MQFNNEYRQKLDLSPAKWIWYPSQRTLSNTFALFRKVITLDEEVISATGYVVADSRYKLYVNGQRKQWGPAPSDPRYMEVDTLDITECIAKGGNVLAFQVLYYGFGEGTWAAGTPGLLFSIDIILKKGKTIKIISDNSCKVSIDMSHKPGEFQRWYLRSLQEICDGNKLDKDWNKPDFVYNKNWVNAMEIGDGNIPSVNTSYSDYANNGYDVTSVDTALIKREIPIVNESLYTNITLAEAGKIFWKKDKDYWFLFREPNIYNAQLGLSYIENENEITFDLDANGKTSSFLTFELAEQIVGFPYFDITAPKGTTIEIITQEGHKLGENLLLDTGYFCWGRYTCVEGKNYYETFDFESFKWLQINVYNPNGGTVKIHKIGVIRRKQPFHEYNFKTSDEKIQRLVNAGFNTIYNAAQETIVDGMGRERQQYSGDASHILVAMRYGLGDKLLNERFIQTYSTGMTKEGLFLDSWPGIDRLKRLSYRQIDLTSWGNIVDHSIQFVFDCYGYYLSSGNIDCIKAPMKAIDKMVNFLIKTCDGGLYPTDDRNGGVVWLDSKAYDGVDYKSKECAINLYIIGMIRHAYVPLCSALNYEESYINHKLEFAQSLLEKVQQKYWCQQTHTYYDNLPYVTDRKELKVADRTLAMAILYELCVAQNINKSLELLKGGNPVMRLSFPCNAVWRMRALAKGEELGVFINELYQIWCKMPSVIQNNTFQESWTQMPDSTSQWSHIASAPLNCIYEGVLGLKCNNINEDFITISPQLMGFPGFKTTIKNNNSYITFQVEKLTENSYTIEINSECKYDLVPIKRCSIIVLSKNKYQIDYLLH